MFLRFFYVFCVLVCVLFVVFYEPYGASVEREPWTVYYEEPVTEDTATKFAEHLVEVLGQNPENERDVQVVREGERGYRFRFGWKRDVSGTEIVAGLRMVLASFRATGLIPNGRPLAVELCDEDFEKFLEFEVGPCVVRDGWTLWLAEPVSEGQATAVAEELARIAPGGPRQAYIDREQGRYRLSFVVAEGALDETARTVLEQWGAAIRASGALGPDAALDVEAREPP